MGIGRVRRPSGQASPIDALHDPATFPPSFVQERFWFLDGLTGVAVYNIVGVFRFETPVTSSLVQRALDALTLRHDALRSIFVVHDGAPRVRVLSSVQVPLRTVDISHLGPRDRDAKRSELIRDEHRQPFDLAKAPLFRPTLVRLSERESTLLVAFHHIIADEWSLGIFESELRAMCGALADNREPDLPSLPFRYVEVAARQREAMQGPARDRKLEFWKSALAGAPKVLDLPIEGARPPSQTFRGALETFELGPSLSARIGPPGKHLRTTSFVTLLAGFAAVLHRYSGQEDLLIGTPVGDREPGTEGIIGPFLNTIAVRTTIDGTMTFRDLVEQVRERVSASRAHRDLPFEQLVAALGMGHDSSRPPLVQVMFVLESRSERPADASLSSLATDTSKFDLTLGFRETSTGFDGWVEYSTDLFDAATIRRFIGHLRTLLAAGLARPDMPVVRLPLMTEVEHSDLLAAHATPVRHAGSKQVSELVADVAARAPLRVAAVSNNSRLTYGELDARVSRLARCLIDRGVGPEVLVGIALERSTDMLVAALAVLRAGGAYVPLDPSLPVDRLAFMVEDSGMAVLVTHHDIDHRWRSRPEIVLRLDVDAELIESQSAEPIARRANDDHLAYVLYTSGSTGTPKGVEVPHSALTNLLHAIQGRPGFSESDTLLAVSTFSFDIAALELFLPIMTGGTVVIADRADVRDPRRLAELIASSGCTVAQATPATWRSLVDAGWRGASHLKLLSGGEALTSGLAASLLGCCRELWNLYGPTETTIYSTLRQVVDPARVDLGEPLEGTDVFVLDRRGELAPLGMPGELCIGGRGLARGYRGRPELTAERFPAHPFQPNARMYRTGDRVRWLPDGRMEFLGREDHQVKLRGYRVELGEVEEALRSHFRVREAVVVLRENTAGDARLVAYVEGPQLEPGELRDYLKQTLPEYSVPNVFVRMATWPLTPSAKIDRLALPAPDDAAMVSPEFRAPSTPTERELAAIWHNLLGVPNLGARDDFFLLGGHSLLAVRLIDRINRTFEVALSPEDLFKAPILAELAAAIDRHAPVADASPDVLVSMAPGGSKTPFFWVHGISGEVFSFMEVSRHMAGERPIYGIAADWTKLTFDAPLTVEQMAARYVERLRLAQPHGPYFLGGFCSGAMIALEMARQLEAADENVGLVAAVDYPLHEHFGDTRPSAMEFLRNLPHWIRDDAMSSGGTDLLKRLSSRWRSAVGGGQSTGKNGDVRDELGMWQYPEREVPMLKLHRSAIESYLPAPTAARVALFIPTAGPLLKARPEADGYGWQPYAGGGVQVHMLPGSHSTLLTSRCASSLAEHLNRDIEAIESERIPSSPGQAADESKWDRESPRLPDPELQV